MESGVVVPVELRTLRTVPRAVMKLIDFIYYKMLFRI